MILLQIVFLALPESFREAAICPRNWYNPVNLNYFN